MDDDKLIEEAARAITIEMGITEQEWESFTNEARAAIAVIRSAVIEECAQAVIDWGFDEDPYELATRLRALKEKT